MNIEKNTYSFQIELNNIIIANFQEDFIIEFNNVTTFIISRRSTCRSLIVVFNQITTGQENITINLEKKQN